MKTLHVSPSTKRSEADLQSPRANIPGDELAVQQL
jgi:hypothetical protein